MKIWGTFNKAYFIKVFYQLKAPESKFDLAKKIKVNPTSSFEQSCQYSYTQCNLQSFKAIVRLVLEKIINGFTLYELGGHAGHVTWTVRIIVSFLRSLKALHEIWLLLTQWLLRKCLKLSKYEMWVVVQRQTLTSYPNLHIHIKTIVFIILSGQKSSQLP